MKKEIGLVSSVLLYELLSNKTEKKRQASSDCDKLEVGNIITTSLESLNIKSYIEKFNLNDALQQKNANNTLTFNKNESFLKKTIELDCDFNVKYEIQSAAIQEVKPIRVQYALFEPKATFTGEYKTRITVNGSIDAKLTPKIQIKEIINTKIPNINATLEFNVSFDVVVDGNGEIVGKTQHGCDQKQKMLNLSTTKELTFKTNFPDISLNITSKGPICLDGISNTINTAIEDAKKAAQAAEKAGEKAAGAVQKAGEKATGAVESVGDDIGGLRGCTNNITNNIISLCNNEMKDKIKTELQNKISPIINLNLCILVDKQLNAINLSKISS
ncbi:hypothetical protein CPAV1605_711 [seawater metagenome]|uniref:Uncharacterized protein n=1 Tax=seawater metagenome TaxID=1561972 RepID=A0A5E8CIR6_9ZZZZ